VDNRGTVIAAELVAKAPPDGYTLLVQGVGTVWMRPLLEKVPWDPAKDFSPISLLVKEVSAIAVHPSVPAKSVKELIALAKARPGELNYATTGTGSTYHLATELFRSMAGINIVHIAYKSGPLMAAVMSGEVHLVIYDAGLLAPHVKSGKLRALAVTSAEPSALVPELPTIAASGLPGYEAVSMTGIWAPAKTPETIINRLSKEIARFINLPDVKEKFFNARLEIVGSSPEQFAAIIKSDVARMSKVIKDAGIKAN
jgi:tripartite-type tricarboxylate transporter receptor subunit TctC